MTVDSPFLSESYSSQLPKFVRGQEAEVSDSYNYSFASRKAKNVSLLTSKDVTESIIIQSPFCLFLSRAHTGQFLVSHLY